MSDIKAYVARSRAAQGLPPTVESHELLDIVACLIEGIPVYVPPTPHEARAERERQQLAEERRAARAATKDAARAADIRYLRERYLADGMSPAMADLILRYA